MKQMTRRVFGVAGFALLLATSASFAQQPPPVRIRGQIEKIEGDVLDIKTRNGGRWKLRLSDPRGGLPSARKRWPTTRAGKSFGSPAFPRPEATQRPTAIHTFYTP